MYYSSVHLCTYSPAYPLGITITKGCQFAEGVGRVTDHCCVDVSGEHDYMCIHKYVHTYVIKLNLNSLS